MNEIDLPAFSVLTGRNGVGKTQLLDAIANGSVSVSDVPESQILKYDIATFQPVDAPVVGWEAAAFAEQIAESFFAVRDGQSLRQRATKVFLSALATVDESEKAGVRKQFEDDLRAVVRAMSDFSYFPVGRGSERVRSYSRELHDSVLGPLRLLQEGRMQSGHRPQRTFGGDALMVLSQAMKLSGKLPHELEREDILRAAYYEGEPIANTLNQAFTRYKVEQYSWSHSEGERGRGTVQDLLSEYRRQNRPPWAILRESLEELRRTSEDRRLFDFEFSDPENDDIAFADHTNYSFGAEFTNRSTGESYSLERLSSGEKILMALCLAAFNQRMGQNRPRVLLLDELDALLHPSMVATLLRGLRRHFVDHGTEVLVATHSITTVSILEDGEVYRVQREGAGIEIVPTTKAEAVGELSEGVATIDTGLRIVASIRSARVTILTEGYNSHHLKRWASLFFPGDVEVFEGLPARTNKNQLLSYGLLLSKMAVNSHILVVWDCDARGVAAKLSRELAPGSGVTALALKRRDNRVVQAGIENKYDEAVLEPYALRVLDNEDVEQARSFPGSKKREFAREILANGTREHFVHFEELHEAVEEILQRFRCCPAEVRVKPGA